MNTPASFDEQWYARLRQLGSQVEETTWFQDHIRISREERDLFLENDTENPRFRYYGKLDLQLVTNEVDALLVDIEHSNTEALVIDLYARKIHNHRIRFELIAASQAGDDETFYTCSTKLYGKPKKEYFAYVAMRVRELCDAAEVVDGAAAKRLRKIVSKITPVDLITAGVLPPEVVGNRIVNMPEVLHIFQETLDRLQISDWQLQVDTDGGRSRFSVNPFKKTIFIPSEEALFSRSRSLTDVQIRALAEHEVGVHARRAYEAQKTPLKLLQIGLDAYLVGEEGLAGYVQQQIEGATEFYGFDRYFAACLAVGMDGERRDFRGVFTIMCDYYTLKFERNDEYTGSPIQAAWDVCMRIFRGTTGTATGCIYTKDLVYMEGNIMMWNMLTERPDRFESLFVGKFNQFNKRHVTSLQTLEILKEW